MLALMFSRPLPLVLALAFCRALTFFRLVEGSDFSACSPSRSPTKHGKLTGPDLPTGNLQRSATPPNHGQRKLSEPQLLATFSPKDNSRAHSTSPGVDDTDEGKGDPYLSGRSASTTGLVRAGVDEREKRQTSSMTLPRNYNSNMKHTVSIKEKSTRGNLKLSGFCLCTHHIVSCMTLYYLHVITIALPLLNRVRGHPRATSQPLPLTVSPTTGW